MPHAEICNRRFLKKFTMFVERDPETDLSLLFKKYDSKGIGSWTDRSKLLPLAESFPGKGFSYFPVQSWPSATHMST